MSAQSNKPPQNADAKFLYKLSQGQYEELERKAIAGNSFRDDTGAVQSGFLNGVEHVLRIVRGGFTSL